MRGRSEGGRGPAREQDRGMERAKVNGKKKKWDEKERKGKIDMEE